MKLIYIAGKYTGKTFSEIENNIRKAEEKAVELISKLGNKGFYPITPHLNTAHFERYEPCLPDINYTYWIKGTIELLLRCDGILMLDNWKDSKGAIGEHSEAEKNKIKIYYSVDDIKE